MAYHRTLHDTDILLEGDGSDPRSLVRVLLERLEAQGKLQSGDRDSIEALLARTALPPPSDLGHGVALLRLRSDGGHTSHTALVRVSAPLAASDGAPVRFLWVVFGTGGPDEPDDDALSQFGWMLTDDGFTADALGAQSGEELLAVYERYLSFVESAPPEEAAVVDELRRSGRPLGGLIADARRRYSQYGSDLADGLHAKVVAACFFLFFACLAPAVAFGGLLAVLTDGAIGAVEMIVATAICGTVYALLSAQPLTILGSTGPVVVFMGILYRVCASLGIPYMPTLCWVGLWTMVCLVILAVTEASTLIKHFTRFTDEIFAALIAIIFIVEAVKDTASGFMEPGVPHDTALLSLVLALGTFGIALQLSRFRKAPYLLRPVREFLADFGPTIAVLAMTGVAFVLHPVDLDTLAVPERVTTTSGRSWIVNPFEAPTWVWIAALGPALLVTVLLYLDQNITVRIVNNKDHRLKKGAGYHLDLLVLALLVGVCSIFGLPWMVAATVRSLNHVRALAQAETHGGSERIVSVRENRVSGLLVHVGVGASLLLLDTLRQIPMSALFGLFLFMGVASMRNNQFFERMRLWIMDPEMYPPTHYLRRVPRRVVHAFTAVQAACLAVLWIVKVSALGILFPLFIALLVPIRFALPRLFDPKHLAFLDLEEEPREEEDREVD